MPGVLGPRRLKPTWHLLWTIHAGKMLTDLERYKAMRQSVPAITSRWIETYCTIVTICVRLWQCDSPIVCDHAKQESFPPTVSTHKKQCNENELKLFQVPVAQHCLNTLGKEDKLLFFVACPFCRTWWQNLKAITHTADWAVSDWQSMFNQEEVTFSLSLWFSLCLSHPNIQFPSSLCTLCAGALQIAFWHGRHREMTNARVLAVSAWSGTSCPSPF